MVSPAVLARVLLAAGSLAAAGPAPTPLSPPFVPAADAAACPATPLAAAAAPVSPTAGSKELPLLPASPPVPPLQPDVPWEYFTVVTLLSAPFTVLWVGLVAILAESVAQRRIPPKFGAPLYAGVGAVAGTTSLGIAVFSLNWGRPAPLSRTAAVRPAPTPAPRGGRP